MGANPYAFDGGQKANTESLNAVTADIHGRLTAVEGLAPAVEAAKDSLVAIGLDRLNTELLPAIRTEQARVERGVLIAGSSTPAALVVGATLNLLVDLADRLSFSPSAFVMLSRTTSTHDFATLQTTNWDTNTGIYTGAVVAVVGDPGPWADWQLGSQAGSTLAQRAYLAEGEAARDATAASAASAAASRIATDADATATAADRAATHTDRMAADTSATNAHTSETNAAGAASSAAASAASISGGPVTSVNGKTGVVTLAAADVGAATPASVTAAIAALVNGAPGVLDTLKELADAMGDDPNFAATISAALNARVRADAPQAFGAGQQATARRNIRSLSRGQALALAIAY